MAASDREAQSYDVVVVGSGAGGMVAALKAHDLGLSVVLAEKTDHYGGTSALSGGQFWIPGNHLMEKPDERATVAEYIRQATHGKVQEDKLQAFIDLGPEMVRYLDAIGIELESLGWHPDYFPELPGGTGGRSLVAVNFDGAALGAEFGRLREPPVLWRAFNRYAMDTYQMGLLGMRSRGWKREFMRMLARYWLDLPWRRKTHRDRRLTLGNALVGRLRKAMLDRQIPIFLNTRLVRLAGSEAGVSGAIFERNGTEFAIDARRGLVLAAGGFEHDQALRDSCLPVPTTTSASLAPGINTGDALRAGLAVGAATEHLEHGWWMPTMQMPNGPLPNTNAAHAAFRNPHSICVNRNGDRFTDEAQSYDRFGYAMIEDHRKTGANPPCWMIFDSQYRRKYACGSILPSLVTPDRKVPGDWWDKHIYRAPSLAELAAKIEIDAAALERSVARHNQYAKTGVDLDFGRGDNEYDRVLAGDPRVGPNPCLGPIADAPYYAVRIDLGDLGTKGGLRVDDAARVLSEAGDPIEGLYAIGNCSGSIFADSYPGPGSTLGPAMTFGFAAAAHIAESEPVRRNASASIYR